MREDSRLQTSSRSSNLCIARTFDSDCILLLIKPSWDSGGQNLPVVLLDVALRPGGSVPTIHMDPNIQGSFLFTNSLNQFPSDLKAPLCQYSVPNSFYKLNPGLNSQLQAGTPHGISDILSRSMAAMGSPGSAAATTTTTLLSGYSSVGGFGPPVNNASVYYNRDYNSGLGSFAKPPAECPMKGHSVSCWAESACDWRGGRQQCTSESASAALTCAPAHASHPLHSTVLGQQNV